MINISTLTSILENHKLTDEQSEELQKVIYKLADGRLVEADPPFQKSARIRILYLCDEKACRIGCFSNATYKYTSYIQHAKNYKSINEVNLEKDFVMHVLSPNDLMFLEKER